MKTRSQVLKMLDDCLRWVEDHADREPPFDVRAFESMSRRATRNPRYVFSTRESGWISDIHEKLFAAPHYENLVSEGRVPRGKEVPTPAVLLNLPKRPPTRRSEP